MRMTMTNRTRRQQRMKYRHKKNKKPGHGQLGSGSVVGGIFLIINDRATPDWRRGLLRSSAEKRTEPFLFSAPGVAHFVSPGSRGGFLGQGEFPDRGVIGEFCLRPAPSGVGRIEGIGEEDRRADPGTGFNQRGSPSDFHQSRGNRNSPSSNPLRRGRVGGHAQTKKSHRDPIDRAEIPSPLSLIRDTWKNTRGEKV